MFNGKHRGDVLHPFLYFGGYRPVTVRSAIVIYTHRLYNYSFGHHLKQNLSSLKYLSIFIDCLHSLRICVMAQSDSWTVFCRVGLHTRTFQLYFRFLVKFVFDKMCTCGLFSDYLTRRCSSVFLFNLHVCCYWPISSYTFLVDYLLPVLCQKRM